MKKLCYMAFLLCFVSSARASIVPVPGSQLVDPVFDASTAVCNCHVLKTDVVRSSIQIKFGRTVTVQTIEATLQVIDVYKGPAIEANQTIIVQFLSETPMVSDGGPIVAKGQRGVMFLTLTNDGRYFFADPYMSVIFLNTLPATAEGSGIAKFQDALVQDLSHASVEEQSEVLNLLQGIKDTSVQESAVLQQISLSINQNVAFKSLAVLMKSNPTLATDRLLSRVRRESIVADGLAMSILTIQITTVTNPEARHNLEELTTVRESGIREAAVYALRHVGDHTSIPVLIRVLDDTNVDIRYQAVMALAEITGKDGEYAPNMEIFSQNPNIFVNRWKEWFLDQKSSDSPPA